MKDSTQLGPEESEEKRGSHSFDFEQSAATDKDGPLRESFDRPFLVLSPRTFSPTMFPDPLVYFVSRVMVRESAVLDDESAVGIRAVKQFLAISYHGFVTRNYRLFFVLDQSCEAWCTIHADTFSTSVICRSLHTGGVVFEYYVPNVMARIVAAQVGYFQTSWVP
jgi:hypothetical protein